MKTYGYIRVSTADQNEDRQLHAMSEFEIPNKNIYTDKISGKNFDRPAYKKLVKTLKNGDLLYIKSIDRLGRNYHEIQEQWRVLTKEKGVDIVVIDIPLLDTRTSKDLIGTLIADLFLQILSFMAQSERETIHQRQAEGIKAARLRGVHLGRPTHKMPENFVEIVKQWERGALTTGEAIKLSKLTKSTFYRRYTEYKIGKNK